MRARAGATRAMALALLVVVALAGMGLGFAADRLAMRHDRDVAHRPGPGLGPGFGPFEAGGRRGGGRRGGGDGMRERFARELELTPQQQRSVDSIMARQMADFRRLRESMQPRFDSVIATAQSRLEAVLTPAQRDKLKSLRAQEFFGPRDSFGGRERRPPPSH